ncbi:MAG: dTDP-4-dehydrorhamnose 3,5-epimerase family protein [Castellaniella sp.]|uniref:dTDP-4-dehydrorhamnose 3,5-epimerase family protein n=1 Tax=Castellaniella sp. TaxID=1955812 RepID=UPI003C77A938
MTTIESTRFSFRSSPLPGVWEADRMPIFDARGSFARFFCRDEFLKLGMDIFPTQMNFSKSNLAGTIRGMHFQYMPNAETKVVTCMSGSVFDVAVDLRYNSPTFLQWFGVTLSSARQNSLIIPPGVAHGFQSLVDQAEILYIVTSTYSSSLEGGLHPLDPGIGIHWPLPPAEISERDMQRDYIDVTMYAGLTQQGGRR